MELGEYALERLRKDEEFILYRGQHRGPKDVAPFSKGTPTPQPKVPGRRRGRRHGLAWTPTRPPTQIDETIDVPLPMQCPDCGGTLRETHIVDQIQDELRVVWPHACRFRVHVDSCRCGRRVLGHHPWQASDALGAASTHLGPQAVAFTVLLNKFHWAYPTRSISQRRPEWPVGIGPTFGARPALDPYQPCASFATCSSAQRLCAKTSGSARITRRFG